MNLNVILIFLLGSIILNVQVEAQRRNQTKEGNQNNGIFNPENIKPLPFFPQPRIVGGSIAKPGQFPHQISLRLGGSHICGGSIISKNYVVTAAHCVTSGNPPRPFAASRLSIRAGSNFVNSGGQVKNVASIIVHPSYKNFDNDIALVRLATPLEFNDNVKAIALASQWPPANSNAVTSGWGRLSNQGPIAQVLQYDTLRVLSYAECSQKLGSLPALVLCLGHTSGKGVCQGDSGGPAVYQNQLVGVTNFVVGGCASRNPDGYASVPGHLNWIKSNSDV